MTSIHTKEQLDDALAILTGLDDWISAADLAESIGLPRTEAGKRIVRSIAESIGGAIISGHCGYKLTTQADADEVRHFAKSQLSQCSKMKDRAVDALRCKGIRL